jgi:acetyl esterase/lipase
MDAEVAAALERAPLDFRHLNHDRLAALRTQQMGLVADGGSAAETVDLTVPASSAFPGVPVRVRRPRSDGRDLPCLVWMHGGGFVLGSSRLPDPRLDEWCSGLGCVGVSVDYRLAPEHPYPAAIDDCYRALLWVFDHARELGVDPARIGVGGRSAGGGLAAGLALLSRDRAEVRIAFQLLINPMLDDRRLTESSKWDGAVWPPSANAYAWDAYLPGAAGTDAITAYAAPARAGDLTGLPPALITVGTLDCFLDEDVDYAMRLAHAGVATELHVHAGVPHGFDTLAPESRVARKSNGNAEAWLRERFAGPSLTV